MSDNTLIIVAVYVLYVLFSSVLSYALGHMNGFSMRRRFGGEHVREPQNEHTGGERISSVSDYAVRADDEAERKRLIEDQAAFRQMMNYSADQAYGVVPADSAGVGDS